MKIYTKILYYILFSFIFLTNANGQNYLDDNDGNGSVNIISIGDSLTYGVGSEFSVGEEISEVIVRSTTSGYPNMLTNILGVPFSNRGNPGEKLINGSDLRAVRAILESSDVVILLAGSNDAIFQEPPSTYRYRIQRVANHANRVNKKLILVTIPEPCCLHSGQELFVAAYNVALRDVANVSFIRVADVDLAFKRACINPFECELLNLPEGLHPNRQGHNLMAYVIAASLLDIDIFAEGGNSKVEQALGLESGSIPSLS